MWHTKKCEKIKRRALNWEETPVLADSLNSQIELVKNDHTSWKVREDFV